jgi:hypothetical protein
MVTFFALCILVACGIAVYFFALFTVDVASSTYNLACRINVRVRKFVALVKVGLAAMRAYQPAQH